MKKIIASIGLWSVPFLALAQGSNTVLTIANRVKAVLDAIVPIAITLALIWFIWGVAKYVTAKEDEEKTEARSVMIYGVIGLFVIVAVWGLVGLLIQFTGVTPSAIPPSIPRIPSL